MANVIVTESLFRVIHKKFSYAQAQQIIDIFESLENNPRKGKKLSSVGGILIKEVKFSTFRFYCITDGHILKFGTEDELASLIIKFVRMSDKKDQQKIIDEIKTTLYSFGFEGF